MAVTDVGTAETAGWRFVDNAAVGGASATAHPKWGVRARKYTQTVTGKGEIWVEEVHSTSTVVVTNLNRRDAAGQ